MKSPFFPALSAATLALASWLALAPGLRADPTAHFTSLHSFDALDGNGNNTEGARPVSALIRATDGNLYGTANDGGAHGDGTVFVATTAGAVSVVHTFGVKSTSGTHPQGGVIEGSDGLLYGTTRTGGKNNNHGTLFKTTLDGTTFTTLFNFGANQHDGVNPKASLIQGADGLFYGTTYSGGLNSKGVVFSTTSTGAIKVIYNFGGDNGHGTSPRGGVIQGTDGLLYGATSLGGPDNLGTVFQLALDGTIDTLHSFSGSGGDGSTPFNGVVEGRDGAFYGTTEAGGTHGDGTVYKVTTGGVPTTLYEFDHTDTHGANPYAGLVLGSDGNFYGTTEAGGANGTGTVFQITPAGALTTIHVFSAVDASGFNADGAKPNGTLLEYSPGLFYGTTNVGGTAGSGVIFKFVVSPVITSPATATATTGTAFSYRITATNAPTSFGATGLPKGLTVNTTTGIISGTPTATGKYAVTLKAGNAGGTDTAALTLTVNLGTPAITSPITATATVGKAFSYQITATNHPTRFGAQGLPGGLGINATTGLISGAPTNVGKFTLTLHAYNATGGGVKTLTLTVNPAAAPSITSAKTATATVGKAFTYQITATNSPTRFGAQGLPPGLGINATTGVISGTPASTTAGTHSITLHAYNVVGQGTAPLTLTINKG